MGREVRKVPEGWEHPKQMRLRLDGVQEEFVPMHDARFSERADEWEREFAAWQGGQRASYFDPTQHAEDVRFWEWSGGPPDREAYFPDWPEESRTHFQLYETVSEGTPVTPVFANLDEMADYLATNGDFWDQKRKEGPKLDRDGYRRFLGVGSAPSMVIQGGQVMTGEQAVARSAPKGGAK